MTIGTEPFDPLTAHMFGTVRGLQGLAGKGLESHA